MLTIGSVCSGIGTDAVALHPLGLTTRWFSEIEPFPSAVLAHRFPSVPNLGDFTELISDQPPTVDLLIGGTPCQSFSIAGLRGGLDDDRGNLALRFVQLADRLRPRWLVWENVPGVLSSGGGRDFGSFLGALAECGYGFAYRVLDAQYFGVPQRRRRVFVVGYPGDWRPPAAVLSERQSLRRDPSPRREEGKEVASCLGGGSGRRGWCSDTDRATFIPVAGTLADSGAGGYRTAGNKNESDFLAPYAPVTAPSLTVGSGGSAGHMHRQSGNGEAVVAWTHGLESGVAATCKSHHQRLDLESDTKVSLSSTPRAFAENTRNELRYEGGDGQVTGALSTGGGKPGRGQPVIQGSHRVRRLSPLEWERLQGLPDNHTLVPWRGGQASDTVRYRAIGNGMAVPVIRWIGHRIQLADALVADLPASCGQGITTEEGREQ